MLRKHWGLLLAGGLAGAVNGLFGAGGGMVLIPLLTLLTDITPEECFPTSISVILPICFVSLFMTEFTGTIEWQEVLPDLLGSAAGGILAGVRGKKIPVKWLQRGLGIMVLWGGWRYLCWGRFL